MSTSIVKNTAHILYMYMKKIGKQYIKNTKENE